jgi:formylglycine-generating enzyme required for sulfatase activity
MNVSWQDAQDYCKWLSHEIGKEYRLPTEAEWEYACRAGSDSVYFFGDDEKLLKKYAWYNNNAGRKTHPVGEKKANAWGLHDMHGNVWEWCQDWYDNKYYAECHQQGVVRNPQGSAKGTYRVLRGGSFFLNPVDCRSVRRDLNHPEDRAHFIGFRVVLPFQVAGSGAFP